MLRATILIAALLSVARIAGAQCDPDPRENRIYESIWADQRAHAAKQGRSWIRDENRRELEARRRNIAIYRAKPQMPALQQCIASQEALVAQMLAQDAELVQQEQAERAAREAEARAALEERQRKAAEESAAFAERVRQNEAEKEAELTSGEHDHSHVITEHTLADEEAAKRRAAANRKTTGEPVKIRRAPAAGVQCCDGTTSPTCTTPHRGCCSRHGGIC